MCWTRMWSRAVTISSGARVRCHAVYGLATHPSQHTSLATHPSLVLYARKSSPAEPFPPELCSRRRSKWSDSIGCLQRNPSLHILAHLRWKRSLKLKTHCLGGAACALIILILNLIMHIISEKLRCQYSIPRTICLGGHRFFLRT